MWTTKARKAAQGWVIGDREVVFRADLCIIIVSIFEVLVQRFDVTHRLVPHSGQGQLIALPGSRAREGWRRSNKDTARK